MGEKGKDEGVTGKDKGNKENKKVGGREEGSEE